MVEKKIRILVIPAWFDHRDKRKGVFIDEFCDSMNSKAIEVSLLYLNFISIRNFFKLSKPKFNQNYRIIVVSLLNLKSKLFFFLSNSFILKQYYNKINKILNDYEFDLIHVQSVCNNVTPYLVSELSAKNKLKYIITEHYSSYPLSKGAVFKPFLSEDFVKKVIQEAKVRIAVSKTAAIDFENYFNSEFEVIPNFINKKFFDPISVAAEKGFFRFIIIAPLEIHKGILDVIDAFQKLRLSNCKLLIIGTGSQIAQVNQAQLNNKSIEIIESLNSEGIIQKLDQSHCLISASDYETFGLTIAEAHLRGLPVIATKSGGPDNLITEENGILIDLNNRKENLMNAMTYIHSNYHLYNKTLIKKNAQLKFDPKIIIQTYKNIYLNIIK